MTGCTPGVILYSKLTGYLKKMKSRCHRWKLKKQAEICFCRFRKSGFSTRLNQEKKVAVSKISLLNFVKDLSWRVQSLLLYPYQFLHLVSNLRCLFQEALFDRFGNGFLSRQ